MVRWYRVIGAVVLLALAGCTLRVGDQDDSSPEAVRAELAAKLAEVQTAHDQALDLWDRLIFGEPVSCQETIPVPKNAALSTRARAAHPQAAQVEGALNAAIRALAQAAASWDRECAEVREWVPVSTARNARESLLSASAALDTAAGLLAAW